MTVSTDPVAGISATARQQLERVILPYWLEHGIDEAHGGFHTCFDNRGRNRTGTDKFTWSQGRFVWLLAHAAELAAAGTLAGSPDDLLRFARRGAQFLADHVIRPDGSCWYATTRTGAPMVDGQPERSVYADCFAVLGLAELARVDRDRSWLTLAEIVLRRARADILAQTGPTPPYPIPVGFTAYGPKMILVNVLLAVGRADRELGGDGPYREWLAEALELMMAHRRPDGTFAELLATGSADAESLLGRHRVPGHAIEGTWMALEAMDFIDDHRHTDALLAGIPALCASAWDPELGGLLHYTDADGPVRPRGSDSGSSYEQGLLRTWDTKLWWVHTEAAVTTMIAARRYGDAASRDWLIRIWDYLIDIFPGGDEGEEWIQIRDRAGRPLDEVVALPVKDPFHIARNLMQLIEP
ncbi:AGE family epimerase/isomerase [Microlunatus speluncae]|uniref:AGE family epimerase/isomerase n=1 Tax=Microlunatus speluncae TaxID=2594267 RepID=UPI00126631C4|nr:AGE family epimerase/isomerase [Microlunatus speluncae]